MADEPRNTIDELEGELTPEQLETIQEIAESPEEPPESDAAVPLTDERAQHQIDLRLLYGAVQQAREELAAAKFAYHLSAAGVSGGKHPKQQAEVVDEKVKQLDVVLTLVAHVEEKGEGIPRPSKLEVATKVP
jgi:hypothetical protein